MIRNFDFNVIKVVIDFVPEYMMSHIYDTLSTIFSLYNYTSFKKRKNDNHTHVVFSCVLWL